MKKMKSLGLYGIVSIFMLGFYHCTSDEAIFTGFPIEWDYHSIQEVHDDLNLSDTIQVAIDDLSEEQIINGPQGTQFILPENSITISGGGDPALPIELRFIEIYKRGDMISHRMQTYDGQNPLVAAGMIWFEGSDANGNPLIFDGAQAVMPYQTDANGYEDAMFQFTGFTQISPSGPVLSWSGGVIGVPFENNEFTVLDLNTDWNHVGAYYEFDEESEEKTQFSVDIEGVESYEWAEVYFASNDFSTVTALTLVEQDRLTTQLQTIPLGVTGKLVGIALIEGKLNFGIQDVTINGDDEFTMSLEQGTIEELQTLLNTLN